MGTFRSCRFCNIVSGEYLYEGIDEPFAANDQFFAIASIGALVEGWTLIVTRRHDLSMKNYYANPLFLEFVDSVLPEMHKRYGHLIVFEHGANSVDSSTACGTAHAHLHLVPLAGSLLPKLQASELRWIECPPSEIAARSGNNEYLFYRELKSGSSWQNSSGYLHVLGDPTSQYFRRLIAKESGKDDFFDYKRFPNLDTSKHTRRVLAACFS